MIQKQRNEMELQGYPSTFLIFFYLLKHFARIISLGFFFWYEYIIKQFNKYIKGMFFSC